MHTSISSDACSHVSYRISPIQFPISIVSVVRPGAPSVNLTSHRRSTSAQVLLAAGQSPGAIWRICDKHLIPFGAPTSRSRINALDEFQDGCVHVVSYMLLGPLRLLGYIPAPSGYELRQPPPGVFTCWGEVESQCQPACNITTTLEKSVGHFKVD